MDAVKLAAVEDLAAWMRVPAHAMEAAEKLAAPAYEIRQALRGVYTSCPVGVYLQEAPDGFLAGIGDDHKRASAQDKTLVYSTVSRLFKTAHLHVPVLLGDWVKVAYSPFIRGAGEALNFFPGHYPGGIPNHASPVASMLTSGLVGAGLGYGAGWLGEKLLPDKWGKGELRRTLAMAGGAGGLGLGAIPGATNKLMGRSFNDIRLLGHQPGETPDMVGEPDTIPKLANVQLGPRYVATLDRFIAKMAADTRDAVKEAWGDSMTAEPESAMRVNVDSMGRTLWESGTDPATAGMTMGALAAAQQMPGGDEPGFVTPVQMANLAAHMGAGYLSGAIVGATLGLLTGMPLETQEKLRQSGMYLGVVKSVVPKLFS